MYPQNVIINALPIISDKRYFSLDMLDRPAKRFIKHDGVNGRVNIKTKLVNDILLNFWIWLSIFAMVLLFRNLYINLVEIK